MTNFDSDSLREPSQPVPKSPTPLHIKMKQSKLQTPPLSPIQMSPTGTQSSHHPSLKALLPDTPGEMLCFDRAEFVRPDFFVDEFVAECRKRVQLEQLRTDLEKYFKRLKGAMIDLINKDYHEFVSLSAHLADLDKQLSALRRPLGSISTDMSESREALDTELASLSKLLKSRNEEAQRSRLIQHAIAVINGLEAAEKSFQDFKENTENAKLLEKAVDQYNITKHYADLTNIFPSTVQSLNRIHALESELINVTERELINTIAVANMQLKQLTASGQAKSNIDRDLVRKIQLLLASAKLMNCSSRIEKTLQIKLVRPAVKRLIDDYRATGKFLSLKPNELSSFFKSVLTLFENPCGLLNEIQTGRNSKAPGVDGFDFCVKSIWPEVVDQIQSNIPHLFMVTNLEDFHDRYRMARHFIKEFEFRCGSQTSVKRLRASAKMISFNSSWPLPSYCTKIEKRFGDKFEERFRTAPGETPSFQIVVNSVDQLFSDKVFIDRLFPRFWKLSIKFLNHYITSIYSKSLTLETSPVPINSSTTDMVSSMSSELSSNSSNQNLPTSASSDSVTSKQEAFIIELDCLYRALPKLESDLESKANIGEGSKVNLFTSISREIEMKRSEMINNLEKSLVKITLNHLQKAKEVPRQYRRTNRDSPSTASGYIYSCVELFAAIHDKQSDEDNSGFLSKELKVRLSTFIARETAPKYCEIVNEVLSSVKKMEESLLKLQKIRKNKPVQNVSSGGRSDDDKIRLQLKIDIEFFVEKFKYFGVKEKLPEMENLVEITKLIQQQTDRSNVVTVS